MVIKQRNGSKTGELQSLSEGITACEQNTGDIDLGAEKRFGNLCIGELDFQIGRSRGKSASNLMSRHPTTGEL